MAQHSITVFDTQRLTPKLRSSPANKMHSIVGDNGAEEVPIAVDPMPKIRNYQQEMLDASIRENIIIAQDTGSGKTLIAILRMRYEIERNSQKVSWFLAPTVVLCEQQHDVIKDNMQVPTCLIHGGLEPNQWTDKSLWKRVLENNRVIVSTPQVLLDALSHGYVHMGRDIGLIIFDEAHHAEKNHPMNCIMKSFYSSLPPRNLAASGHSALTRDERPMVLGLTASPTSGGNAAVTFRTLEAKLDCVIRSPRTNLDELVAHVHRPVFQYVCYSNLRYFYTSKNISAVEAVRATMNIEEDPYIIELRATLAKTPYGPDYVRLDQELSKAIQDEKTYSHSGLSGLANAAKAICYDLGPWAADWYVNGVVSLALGKQNPYDNFTGSLQAKEKAYLIKHLAQIKLTPVSFDPADIEAGITDKVRVLLDTLEHEKERSDSLNEPYSGLIFVERRDGVLALAEILSRHPRSSPHFRLGCLLGSSHTSHRNTFLDITRRLMKDQSQSETLIKFRSGDKNLIIATSVAEEGLDIQACGNVIRWDIPQNMASWVQSRGRARRKRSSFVLMLESVGYDHARVEEFERLERQMTALYQADLAEPQSQVEDEFVEDDPVFKIESTGAMLTPLQAITHLNHFCAVLPSRGHTIHIPIYDIDPPDFPEGWHSLEQRVSPPPYPGPFGCTVTLPRLLPRELRVFTVDRIYPTKRSACRHAAFKAYLALYHANLLNDHLLPLTSVIEPDQEEEVKNLLKDVEKRSGMALVTGQMNPWQSEMTGTAWAATRIIIPGFAPVRMLTQVDLPCFNVGEAPVLHHPYQGRIEIGLRPQGVVHLTPSDLQVAQESTRRLFWCPYGTRMDRNRLDFAYLLEPAEEDPDRHVWAVRQNQLGELQEEDDLLVNAATFGDMFSYPADINWVRDGYTHGKVYRFLKWADPSEEELEEFKTSYSRVPETCKLLHVEELPRRANFLLPLESQSESLLKTRSLWPEFSRVLLLSRVQCDHVSLMPSIIRSISIALTVVSLRDTLFAGTPLCNIPLSLLITAVTAPMAQDNDNYERLETLGDGVLKFVVSMYLLSTYPLWHEGYLTMRKDHVVSNSQLAKDAIRLCLYKWIIRDRFTPRKFAPHYTAQVNVDLDLFEDLSTKMLADVVESLIGAAFLHGGFNLGIGCIRLFCLGIDPSGWQPLEVCIEKILSRVEVPEPESPPQTTDVELMLGYIFSHKLLLVEAVTHASYLFGPGTVSYERMEFLGDSVLDMVVTHHLYQYPGKPFSPGQMQIRKSAVVNADFLAFICFQCSLEKDASLPRLNQQGVIVMDEETQRISLYQCLLHSSTEVIDQQRSTLARYRKVKDDIEEALHHGTSFPWAALTRLQAPKFFSDMIESLIGAVYLDSHGNLDTVCQVLRKLGIMQYLERILKDDVDVSHPVSRLHIWAAREKKEVKIHFEEELEKDDVTCTITVEGREPVQATAEKQSQASREEARFSAAEKAIKLWNVGTFDSDRST